MAADTKRVAKGAVEEKTGGRGRVQRIQEGWIRNFEVTKGHMIDTCQEQVTHVQPMLLLHHMKQCKAVRRNA